MSTVTKRPVRGEWKGNVPSLKMLPERGDSPEWHSLRLFGKGRHPGAFVAGSEKRAELVAGLSGRL